MKPYIFFALAISLLTGCGGGSSENSSTPEAKNNAPILNGELSLLGKANSNFTASFATQDLDGDAITIKFENQPQWLDYTFESNTLTLSGTPQLIDVEKYKTNVVLSDGKQSQSYTLEIDIADNPENWQAMPITAEDLRGAWQSEAQNTAFIFANGSGYWIIGEKKYKAYITFPSDQEIKLNYYDENSHDKALEYYELIAKSDSKLRLLKIVNGKRQAITFQAVDQGINKSFHYTSTPDEDTWFAGGNISLDSNTRSHITVAPQHAYGSVSVYAYEPKISGTYDKNTSELTSIPNLERKFCWQDVPFGIDNCPSLTLEFDNVKVHGVFNNSLLYTVPHRYTAELSEEQKENMPDLVSFLDKQYTTVYVEQFQTIEKIARPEITIGNTYTGRVLFAHREKDTTLNGVSYQGNSTFTITSPNTGEFDIQLAGLSAKETFQFTYELTDESIKITFDGETQERFFYTLPNGLMGMSNLYSTEYSDGFDIRPFVTVDKNLTLEDSIGSFAVTTFPDKLYQISYDGIAISYKDSDLELEYLSRWEQDNSITYFMGCKKNEYSSIEKCKEDVEQAPIEKTRSITTMNLKLLYKKGSYYLFQHSHTSDHFAEQYYLSMIKQ